MSEQHLPAAPAARALPPLDTTGAPAWGAAAGQSARSAFEALARHKLRSALTMLGIVVGIAGVLIISVFGQLATVMLGNSFSQIGANLINAETIAAPIGGVASSSSVRPTFSEQEIQTIRRQVPHVIAISPRRFAAGQLVAGAQNWKTSVAGVYPEYQLIQSLTTSSGAFFTNQDETAGAAVAVIGPTVATKLFSGINPVGQPVRVNDVDFRVIGVLTSKGSNGQNDLDDLAIVPYSIFNQRLQGGQGFTAMNIQVDQGGNIPGVMAAVTKILAQSRQIPDGAPLDFKVTNFTQVADSAKQEVATINLVLTVVAGVALVIGGFGIVNIMLLSVTERTREIGVRLAVGAQPADVLRQFLIEAVTMSLVGGIIGMVAGFALSLGATAYLSQFIAGQALSPSVSAMAVAVGVSFVTGVIFGLYPARRAAQLNPIEALRYA